jgi:hypothetical protein
VEVDDGPALELGDLDEGDPAAAAELGGGNPSAAGEQPPERDREASP